MSRSQCQLPESIKRARTCTSRHVSADSLAAGPLALRASQGQCWIARYKMYEADKKVCIMRGPQELKP